ESVPFQARLASDGARVFGETVEPNTFGDHNIALFLTATLSGVVNADGSVRFAKTYDGAGGQTHTVAYDGALDAAGQCVVGTWRLEGASGPFRLCREERFVGK